MDDHVHVRAFYTRHPISAEHILAKITATRGNLDGLAPPDLFSHDQDHYGGLEVNDRIAARSRMAAGLRVADFCAGLGGPARYFAHTYGVTVTGIELTPSRAAGANRLTAAVGLSDRVRVIEGDVTAVPLAAASQDIVVSQEALLHVPAKPKALDEAFRILRPGGRLCFTDWIAHRPLSEDEARTMWTGIAAHAAPTIAAYRAMIEAAGFRLVQHDDLTADWAVILDQRRRMYVALREETRKAGKPSGDDSFYSAYVKLVDLVQSRALGGARFTAEKP
jgi:sarcosine/dimethylglycine N-methyltransferase